jgi:hypothetical protein
VLGKRRRRQRRRELGKAVKDAVEFLWSPWLRGVLAINFVKGQNDPPAVAFVKRPAQTRHGHAVW